MVSAGTIFLPEHYVRLRGQCRWSLLLLIVWQSIYFLLGWSVCFCACTQHTLSHFPGKPGRQCNLLPENLDLIHTCTYLQYTVESTASLAADNQKLLFFHIIVCTSFWFNKKLVCFSEEQSRYEKVFLGLAFAFSPWSWALGIGDDLGNTSVPQRACETLQQMFGKGRLKMTPPEWGAEKLQLMAQKKNLARGSVGENTWKYQILRQRFLIRSCFT